MAQAACSRLVKKLMLRARATGLTFFPMVIALKGQVEHAPHNAEAGTVGHYLTRSMVPQAPDLATIKAAIYEEARKRGTESSLKEEAPRRAIQGNGEDINRQIMELLEQALGFNRAAGEGAQPGASNARDALAEAAAALAQAQQTFAQANGGGNQAGTEVSNVLYAALVGRSCGGLATSSVVAIVMAWL